LIGLPFVGYRKDQGTCICPLATMYIVRLNLQGPRCPRRLIGASKKCENRYPTQSRASKCTSHPRLCIILIQGHNVPSQTPDKCLFALSSQSGRATFTFTSREHCILGERTEVPGHHFQSPSTHRDFVFQGLCPHPTAQSLSLSTEQLVELG